MDKEKSKEPEYLKRFRMKSQRLSSRFTGYILDGKRIPAEKARKLFGNKLDEFIDESRYSRYDGSPGKEFSTEHGVLKIVYHVPPILRKKQRYDIYFVPGFSPDYRKEAEELCKSAKYKLNGKVIPKEKAEELFGEGEVADAVYSAAWHFVISPSHIITYDSDYGELSFRFLKKIRHELAKKNESEFKFTKSKGLPKSQ